MKTKVSELRAEDCSVLQQFRNQTRKKRGGNCTGFQSTSNVDTKRIAELFGTYADEEGSTIIDIEGISRLGEDIGIDPATDVRILMLIWKMGAERPGEVSKEEFESGMEKMGVDSIESIKQILPHLDPGFMEHAQFRDFYRFAFLFSREGMNKAIEKEIVMALLSVVISNRSTHTTQILEFLNQCNTTRITFDQWNSFLEFSQRFPEPDFHGYDCEGAWPLLLDEFVEWSKMKNKPK